MFLRALGIWLLLLIVAVLNGAIREVLITPRFGDRQDISEARLFFAQQLFSLPAFQSRGLDPRTDARLWW